MYEHNALGYRPNLCQKQLSTLSCDSSYSILFYLSINNDLALDLTKGHTQSGIWFKVSSERRPGSLGSACDPLLWDSHDSVLCVALI